MRKFIVISIVFLMIAGFAITSSAQVSDILIVKIADTEAAAPGDTVTYSYTVTNAGDVTLSAVTVNDNLAGSAGYVSGDTNVNVLLEVTETWIFTAEYIIPEDPPEYLCNIATAEGWDGVGLVSDDSNEVCIHTMGARTIGYWKNHEDWCDFLPEEDSIFFDKTPEMLLTYFPGNGIEEDGVNPLEMLRVQLLAAELNVACFDIDFDYSRYEGDLGSYGTIYEVIEAAEDFLSLNPPELWPTDKAGQREFRKDNADSLALKDVLDTFNNMGDEIFE